MLPVISPGAMLTIETGSFGEQAPQPGEIVAFRRGEGLVCHRFYGTLRIGKRQLGIERGDNNRIAGLFRLENYVGRLHAVDGQSGETLFRMVRKPGFLQLVIGLIHERWDWLVRGKIQNFL